MSPKTSLFLACVIAIIMLSAGASALTVVLVCVIVVFVVPQVLEAWRVIKSPEYRAELDRLDKQLLEEVIDEALRDPHYHELMKKGREQERK